MRIIAIILTIWALAACGAAPQAATTPPSVLRSEIVTPPLGLRTPPEFAAPNCGRLRSDEARLKPQCARETLASGATTGPKCQALDAVQGEIAGAKCE